MSPRTLVPIVLAVVLLTLGSVFSTARGQVPSELTGRWIWSVEGRPTFILDVDETVASGAILTRPEQVTLMRDGTVGDVQGPVSAQPLELTVEASNRLKLVRRSDGRIYYLRLKAPGSALMTLGDAPIPPLVLYRPYDPDVVVADWGGDRSYDRMVLPQDQIEPNPELAALFNADQAVRQNAMTLGSDVAQQDRQRRERVRELISAGEVRSGRDYYHAAFIFQHGDNPDDYLLAHALAVTAVALNETQASWIAAATLDRYLQNIGRPQIYGTQFQIPHDGGDVTQGAYDRDLISDSVRAAAGVPSLAEQDAQAESYRRQRDTRPSTGQ
ncbi:hypothetical protein [Brevundimonas nasdae]|uniref:Uncharacterized protein n=1 Tax=Brevundimonas nasdae TaxID=172043 RepID=A0ABX8TL26_9CAUL|nr:hypothetical protein [Brevundimonas nasdae]QYC11095.1 hypothetical protein KWG56_03530 [Brevundimonas nasdae]QYC13882.1 hypothetical protein KWG63_17085 [Brevundimonas nasdae]